MILVLYIVSKFVISQILPFVHTSDSQMSTLANNEDPDKMPYNAAFHQGLHCLLRQKLSCNLSPLNIYNGPSKVYCIKPEGRIH